MTKVLVRQHCCPLAAASLQSLYGAEDFLDDLHRARPAGGFSAATLVGPGRDHSRPFHLLVGRLPQRLVLSSGALQDWFIVKVPIAVQALLPVSVQVPVIEVPLSVIPFVAVPVTAPLRVRVFPLDCTRYEKVPVTVSFELTVKIIDPLSVPPEGRHCPEFELRNWKYEMLSDPSPPTENTVIKLKPDALLLPPAISACHVPPAVV